MEKNQQGDMPPPYAPQGYGFSPPQNPPSYHQTPGQAPLHPHQGQPMYPGQPLQYTQQHAYPNVIVQQPMGGPIMSSPPPDHMTSAIFVTLCCFWPTGIIAIMKANEAKNSYIRGDVNGANNAARSAKQMVNISIIAGVCSLIVGAVIIGLYWGLFLSQLNNDGY